MEKTVVIVDDSIFAVRQLQDFFSTELNFSVVGTGSDGNDAVKLFRKFQPALITLDITMPNKNGMEAARQIKAEFPEARILMITAVRGKEVTNFRGFGARAVVTKPLQLHKPDYAKMLKDAVDEALADAQTD